MFTALLLTKFWKYHEAWPITAIFDVILLGIFFN